MSDISPVLRHCTTADCGGPARYPVWIDEAEPPDFYLYCGSCAVTLGDESACSELERYREALREIATRPTVERNPDGEDQAAWTMQLIAREALDA